MEVAEVLPRVGQEQHGAAGDPLSDHLEHKLESRLFVILTKRSLMSDQSVDVRTLPDQVEVAGVWPLME